jgi:hypothetical protein
VIRQTPFLPLLLFLSFSSSLLLLLLSSLFWSRFGPTSPLLSTPPSYVTTIPCIVNMAKRLERELERLFADLPPWIDSITLRDNDNKQWVVVFLGPVCLAVHSIAQSLSVSLSLSLCLSLSLSISLSLSLALSISESQPVVVLHQQRQRLLFMNPITHLAFPSNAMLLWYRHAPAG